MATNITPKIMQMSAAFVTAVLAFLVFGVAQPASAAGPFELPSDFEIDFELVLPDFGPTASVVTDCDAEQPIVMRINNLLGDHLYVEVRLDGVVEGHLVSAGSTEDLPIHLAEDHSANVVAWSPGYGEIYSAAHTLNCTPNFVIDTAIGLLPGVFDPADLWTFDPDDLLGDPVLPVDPADPVEPAAPADPAPVEPAPVDPAPVVPVPVDPAPADPAPVVPEPVEPPPVEEDVPVVSVDLVPSTGDLVSTEVVEDVDLNDYVTENSTSNILVETSENGVNEAGQRVYDIPMADDPTDEQAADVVVGGQGSNQVAIVVIGLLGLGIAASGGFAYVRRNGGAVR